MLDKKYPFVLCFLKVLPNNRPHIAQKTKDIQVGSYFCASNHQESSVCLWSLGMEANIVMRCLLSQLQANWMCPFRLLCLLPHETLFL